MERCHPLVGMDFHSPGASELDCIYAFVHASEKYPAVAERAAEWGTALKEAPRPDFAAETFTRSGDYNSRWNTPRFGGFCQEELRIPGVSLETPYGLVGTLVMTREKYQEAGRRIADAIVARAKDSAAAKTP